ncbi:hypothetical protein SH661x_001577 [Planctomicrobium sp. SH661]|uniref:hypothetical protein n=1 Tax=Planctomicrobium sp. SH661 TaxID=3448124 RepID=UPI003F5C9312
MNKAFVREPDDDGRAYCPRCGSLGTPVTAAPLEAHILPAARGKLGQTAWFCSYPPCQAAYFDQLGGLVTTDELQAPIYPKSPDAPICPCFHFTIEEIEADVESPVPVRIRELLAKSQSEAARCGVLAADGRCCMTEVKRIYMKLRGQRQQPS